MTVPGAICHRIADSWCFRPPVRRFAPPVGSGRRAAGFAAACPAVSWGDRASPGSWRPPAGTGGLIGINSF